MWQGFLEQRRLQKVKMLRKVVLAIRHRRKVVLSKIMNGWSSWSRENIEQRQAVYERLVQRYRHACDYHSNVMLLHPFWFKVVAWGVLL